MLSYTKLDIHFLSCFKDIASKLIRFTFKFRHCKKFKICHKEGQSKLRYIIMRAFLPHLYLYTFYYEPCY